MARPGEAIAATGSTLASTPVALSFAGGAAATRSGVLNALYNLRHAHIIDRTSDFAQRHTPYPLPFDNPKAESLLLKFSGSLPEQTQYITTYIGLVLNFLSIYGYLRSNRPSFTSNIPALNNLRPFIDIASTFSLAIAPSLLLSMIEQYKYLLTAQHLGTPEAVMVLVPALLVLAMASIKAPSAVEGAGYLLKDTVVSPIAGAVRIAQRGAENTRRRKARQLILNGEKAERKKLKRGARLFPHFSKALEKEHENSLNADAIREELGEPVYDVEQRTSDIKALPIISCVNPTKIVLGTLKHPIATVCE